MRKARVFSHEVVMPRMSWSPKNLYNLIARSTVPYHASQTSFTKTALTMYQQRWRSKRFLRAYHGDWIPEKRFKRWFLPTDLPRFQPPQVSTASTSGSSTGPKMGGAFDRAMRLRTSVKGSGGPGQNGTPQMEKMPTASLFMRDVERRLDVVVFRCCFARSAYEARALVVQGKVSLNGKKCSDPNVQLNPGDLISIEPEAVPMLSKELEKKALKALAAEVATGEGASGSQPAEGSEAAEASEASEAAVEQSSGESDSAPASTEAAEGEGEGEGDKKAAAAAESSEAADAATTDKGKARPKTPQPKVLPPGVRPFNLPPYAAPFLFIPPYLETSFTTCSAIYIRHPTIVPHRDRETGVWSFRTDLPSPYPAGGELYSMAWELYVRNSPRVRGQARRIKVEGRVGRNGFVSARARDLDRKRVALRRGWGRTKEVRGWRKTIDVAHVNAAPATTTRTRA
ncbi:uncharacterized protein PFL1_04790 [Pseudozyma flocculosa PF-1]|uniref:Related to ribosomal protein S4, mitochondrial n=2 Tax=Pseudozyma flocculosa TaxID=84751 RepID=A0A5C3F5G8_9BASI|nr:uncharacterized protein PFL1_04790 [Pseudozyma flocculosa PF-1]EPQ27652.1 hypothetical protein PFL1_04790 [Pseudozyma flocculosa PF-1]SPO39216.1 related to ribosomal protein S4 precursor, mitochondrial [Pseudozyma flocculosa]